MRDLPSGLLCHPAVVVTRIFSTRAHQSSTSGVAGTQDTPFAVAASQHEHAQSPKHPVPGPVRAGSWPQMLLLCASLASA